MMLAEALLRLTMASSVAVTDVTVIDLGRGVFSPDQTVIVVGGRIAAVGPASETAVPAGADRVDGRGRFLMPGLCDMHVHSGSYDNGRRMARVLIANGITCVRDMGAPPDDVIRLRDDIRSGQIVGPEMVVAGPLLQTSLPPSLAGNPMLLPAGTAAQARAAVRSLRDRGVDFVKVSSSVPRQSYFAIADACRRVGLPFAGHVPPSVTAEQASRAGQASIEHLGGNDLSVLRSCSRREAPLARAARRMLAEAVEAIWAGREPDGTAHLRLDFTQPVLQGFDTGRAAALLSLFKHRHTWQTPTLLTLQRSWRSAGDSLPAADRAGIERLVAKASEMVRMMRDAGVGLLAGTDQPLQGDRSPLPDELAALVAAGLSPAEALRGATSGPAAFLGRRDWGAVEVGARADLVLLESNPLQDVTNVKRVAAVVVRGRLLRGDELARLRQDGARQELGPGRVQRQTTSIAPVATASTPNAGSTRRASSAPPVITTAPPLKTRLETVASR